MEAAVVWFLALFKELDLPPPTSTYHAEDDNGHFLEWSSKQRSNQRVELFISCYEDHLIISGDDHAKGLTELFYGETTRDGYCDFLESNRKAFVEIARRTGFSS
jgi:hypothetical protein